MFKPVPGGSFIEVQGLKCQIPPLGMGVHSVTGEVAPTDILKRSKNPKEQYWEAPKLPEDFEERVLEEKERQKLEPQYIDGELEAIREREWRRRLYGCWFWNYNPKKKESEPVFLTGLNYFYLTYWELDTGLPDFRIIDLEYFYFWEYCVQDPLSYGMIEVCKRRNGKTSRAACMIYECISRTKRALGGIQSKTEKDAQDIFDLNIVPAFQMLPSFFRPNIDAQSGNTPKKELKFSVSEKGKKAVKNINNKDQLRSVINYKASNPKAYDGKKTKRLILDESGKVDTDVISRHQVVRKCLVDNNRKIVGKLVVTSTVEELGVQYRFDDLWKWSDQKKREKDGRSKSGLYQFFIPADRSGGVDQYGYCDEAATREMILLERESLRDNPSDYINEIRKEPLTIEEAFRTASNKGHYNEIKLGDRLDQLMWQYDEKFWQRGNFAWENGEKDTKVVWLPSSNGRWTRVWFFEDLEQTNQVVRTGNRCRPKSDFAFVSGCDPVDHNKVEDDGRASKAASFVLRRNDPVNKDDGFLNAFVSMYHFRPEYSSMFYEDMLMQCVYFGCKILVETQKPKIKDYFKDRGYGEFLIQLPQYKEEGIPSTPENKQTMVELTEDYIERNIDRVYFPKLIEDWLKFDIGYTQKYDLAMAAGWTLVANMSRLVRKKVAELRDINDFFKLHQAG